MKKTIFLAMLFYGVFASAQLRDNKLNGINLHAGYLEDGYTANLTYNLFMSNHFRNNFFMLNFSYSESSMESGKFNIPYNLISAHLGYFYNVYTNSKGKLNFNLGGGGLIGKEKLNNGVSSIDENTSLSNTGSLIYGPFVGAELNLFIINSLCFTFNINEQYHLNSSVGKLSFYGGAGFKFLF